MAAAILVPISMPIGRFLGLFFMAAFVTTQGHSETCNQCDLCGMTCHGAAAVGPGGAWKPMECLGCMDCSESCRRGSLGFQFVLPWRKEPGSNRRSQQAGMMAPQSAGWLR